MVYVCIYGGLYRDLDFDARERIRESLRRRIEEKGVRFLEYCWVWDEKDRCLLVAGTYERMADAAHWIESLQEMGFEIVIRRDLPGASSEQTENSSAKTLRRGWDLASSGRPQSNHH
ncbi:conserved hypothetical protein [delta proteobacterium NaphS2]|nr:conserved hypothetical protein [delta proteobacterium NaphS2]